MMDKPYGEYLKSYHWDSVRLQALRRAGHRCQLCGNPDMLHVHHNNYDHLWAEGPGDVVVLCDRCHAWHHQAKALHDAHAGVASDLLAACEALLDAVYGSIATGVECVSLEPAMKAAEAAIAKAKGEAT